MHPTVPKGLCVAFYKGVQPGVKGLYSRTARFIDRGIYSHTELVIPNFGSASSSFIDKGVRVKQINYTSVGDWDFLPVKDTEGELAKRASDWFLQHNGQAYDLLGNLRFASNAFSDSKDRWFCSEAVIESMGFSESFRYGPNGAAAFLQDVFGTKITKVSG